MKKVEVEEEIDLTLSNDNVQENPEQVGVSNN